MSSTPDELMGIFRQVTLPIGGVVAIARLDAAFQLGNRAHGTALPAATVVKQLTNRPMPECFTVRYDDFGGYAPGRGAWLLRDVKPLNPPVDERPPRVFRSPAGVVSACMTTPGRLACVVPFCRRTTARVQPHTARPRRGSGAAWSLRRSNARWGYSNDGQKSPYLGQVAPIRLRRGYRGSRPWL